MSGSVATENVYEEPVLSLPGSVRSLRTRRSLVPPASEVVDDGDLSSVDLSVVSAAATEPARSGATTVTYRSQRTTVRGFFKKRKTVVDCGVFKKFNDG